ncbi:MAG: two-component sensor histidine kinase [Bacteroidetes bacterium]|nr:MAG: two-component sensor histidine kinase [Bacteroidota bacterium]REK04976.1 MAG: two-component sensor histidine kinase [Bacteroidota bacterium]REK36520.1 MAG: two-component sensor histidine kinase [Bacteroidota bacterium]REK50886.1 MAG: two-component sensor histidine kinase [Bacteroidota bacterium]
MRPVIFLYVLAFYILLQFSWWAYLLIDLNNEVFEHRIENVALTAVSEEAKQAETILLEKKIRQRHLMVIGEGAVFLILLAWGAAISIRSFNKEVELARQQKNFLLSITHEFKSPLASIKLYLETILKHKLEKEKETAFINSAIRDAERLDNLVENTLLANLMDHQGYKFAKEEINFSAFVRLISQKLQTIPNQAKLICHIEDNLFIIGDKNALSMMVFNLVENARKYSTPDSIVELRLEDRKNSVELCVMDNGIGIPDNEKQKVFHRFYRIGNEEKRKTKGTGLGLFIVNYIVSGHKGTIKAIDNKPKGTIMKVNLPKMQLS